MPSLTPKRAAVQSAICLRSHGMSAGVAAKSRPIQVPMVLLIALFKSRLAMLDSAVDASRRSIISAKDGYPTAGSSVGAIIPCASELLACNGLVLG